MMSFFVFKKSTEDVAEFAADMCKLLRLGEPEQRYSDNHPNGRYHRAQALGIDITFDDADVSADYIAGIGDDFRVTLWARGGVPINDHSFLEGLADLIARMIARAGYRVARPLSPRIGSPVLWYSMHLTRNGSSWRSARRRMLAIVRNGGLARALRSDADFCVDWKELCLMLKESVSDPDSRS